MKYKEYIFKITPADYEALTISIVKYNYLNYKSYNYKLVEPLPGSNVTVILKPSISDISHKIINILGKTNVAVKQVNHIYIYDYNNGVIKTLDSLQKDYGFHMSIIQSYKINMYEDDLIVALKNTSIQYTILFSDYGDQPRVNIYCYEAIHVIAKIKDRIGVTKTSIYFTYTKELNKYLCKLERLSIFI